MSQRLGREAGQFFDDQIPLGRHGRPDDVAQAMVFLASNASSYVSGSALMVDGAFCAWADAAQTVACLVRLRPRRATQPIRGL